MADPTQLPTPSGDAQVTAIDPTPSGSAQATTSSHPPGTALPLPAAAYTAVPANPSPSPTPSPAPTPSPTQILAHRAVRAVTDAMAAANHPITHTLRILPATAPTAAAAAAQIPCEVGAIANSLIFELDSAPLLILTSGGHRVDTKALAARLGVPAKAIKRGKPEWVKEVTGMAIGGVAPVGHRQRIRTLVDEELAGFGEVWVAGGHHMVVFPVQFGVLVEVTGGEVVKVD